MSERVAQRAFGDLPGDRCGSVARPVRRSRNERSPAAAHLDDPFLLKSPVRVPDGVGVQLQVVRQLARPWKAIPHLEHADQHGPRDFVGNLPVHGPGIVLAQLDKHGCMVAH